MSIVKEFSHRRGFFNGYLRHISDSNEVSNQLSFSSSGEFQDPTNERHPENVVKNDDSMWTSLSNEDFGQWIQIELKQSIFDISAYAIGHGSTNYPKEFDFSVSFDGDNWLTLHNHTKSDDLKDIKGKIYRVNRVNARFFKWTNRGYNGNPKKNDCFYISFLDLYGTVISCHSAFGCTFFPYIQKMTIKSKDLKYLNLFIYIMLIKK